MSIPIALLLAFVALAGDPASREAPSSEPPNGPPNGPYWGFELRDNLALEVSSIGDCEVVYFNELAGCGTSRLDLRSSRNTVTVKAVGDLSLQELQSWRGNWRLFGTVGYYRDDVDPVAVQMSF